MTIKELYKWGKEHKCLDYDMIYSFVDEELHEDVVLFLEPRTVYDSTQFVTFNDGE